MNKTSSKGLFFCLNDQKTPQNDAQNIFIGKIRKVLGKYIKYWENTQSIEKIRKVSGELKFIGKISFLIGVLLQRL